MEPGRFQFAIRMFEGEMEVATSAAGYVSEPGMHPPGCLAGGAPARVRRMACGPCLGLSTGNGSGGGVLKHESSNCPSVSLCWKKKKSTQS